MNEWVELYKDNLEKLFIKGICIPTNGIIYLCNKTNDDYSILMLYDKTFDINPTFNSMIENNYNLDIIKDGLIVHSKDYNKLINDIFEPKYTKEYKLEELYYTFKYNLTYELDRNIHKFISPDNKIIFIGKFFNDSFVVELIIEEYKKDVYNMYRYSYLLNKLYEYIKDKYKLNSFIQEYARGSHDQVFISIPIKINNKLILNEIVKFITNYDIRDYMRL